MFKRRSAKCGTTCCATMGREKNSSLPRGGLENRLRTMPVRASWKSGVHERAEWCFWRYPKSGVHERAEVVLLEVVFFGFFEEISLSRPPHNSKYRCKVLTRCPAPQSEHRIRVSVFAVYKRSFPNKSRRMFWRLTLEIRNLVNSSLQGRRTQQKLLLFGATQIFLVQRAHPCVVVMAPHRRRRPPNRTREACFLVHSNPYKRTRQPPTRGSHAAQS